MSSKILSLTVGSCDLSQAGKKYSCYKLINLNDMFFTQDLFSEFCELAQLVTTVIFSAGDKSIDPTVN
jgi:hypothetical protein